MKVEYYEHINNQSGKEVLFSLFKQHTMQFKEIASHKVNEDNVLVGELRLECHGNVDKTRDTILREFSGSRNKPVLSVEIDPKLLTDKENSLKNNTKDI